MSEFGTVSPGDDVSGILLNSRWINGVSGLLNGGEFRPNEKDGGVVIVREVFITASIEAVTWDKDYEFNGKKYPKLTPTRVTMPEFFGHPEDRRCYTVVKDVTVSFYSFFKKGVEVAAGKARIGLVIGDRVFNIDCEEIDLPTDW